MSYSVKEISEKLDISPHTVRYYSDKGLIPTVQRDEHGRRVFTEECVGWFETIHCLRACGMSINDVKAYVDLCRRGVSTASERLHIIEYYAHVARQQLLDAQRRIEFVDRKIAYYQDLMAQENKKHA